jgi:hypothetical protein
MECPDPRANSAPGCRPAPTGEPWAVCRAGRRLRWRRRRVQRGATDKAVNNAGWSSLSQAGRQGGPGPRARARPRRGAGRRRGRGLVQQHRAAMSRFGRTEQRLPRFARLPPPARPGGHRRAGNASRCCEPTVPLAPVGAEPGSDPRSRRTRAASAAHARTMRDRAPRAAALRRSPREPCLRAVVGAAGSLPSYRHADFGRHS